MACPGLPGEKITERLDGLPARLAEYAELGAVFAKWVHAAVSAELTTFGVDLAGVVLKPNMVLEGAGCASRASAASVASATRRVLASWSAELAGVAFLSGGQAPERAIANLAAICADAAPWPLTFSFGRALVDPALAAWARSFGDPAGEAGGPAGVRDGQAALAERVRANAAAVRRPVVTEPHTRQVVAR